MSRESVADALDRAAEAIAQAAHELRGTSQSEAGASAPPAPAPAAPLPAKRTAPATGTYAKCPAHAKDWTPSKFADGPGYCTAKSDEQGWSKNGYCNINERSAIAWVAQHPPSLPKQAEDVDDVPF